MLPNKFFENIQSGTPVLVSNYPAIASLTNMYRIGIALSPFDIKEISTQIDSLRLNTTLYKELKSNVMRAKKDLCWENEKKILQKFYLNLNK